MTERNVENDNNAAALRSLTGQHGNVYGPLATTILGSGTGAQQSIPHLLGVIPTHVEVVLRGVASDADVVAVTDDADSTNVYITGSAGCTYVVMVWNDQPPN